MNTYLKRCESFKNYDDVRLGLIFIMHFEF